MCIFKAYRATEANKHSDFSSKMTLNCFILGKLNHKRLQTHEIFSRTKSVHLF